MNTQVEHEVLKAIRVAGIIPVMVEGIALDEDSGASMVTGGLEDYLNVPKTMGVKDALVRMNKFEEADLIKTEAAG